MIFQANPTEDKVEVILLERIGKLGQMGEVVRVKDGYARNFLLPKGKALRATSENRTRFETMKVELNARNLQLRSEAEKIAAKLDGSSFIVLRQAGETGHLYGSVSTRDLAAILSQSGFVVERSQLALNAPIKTIGLHKIPISLHPEVEALITVNVARNTDEAARQARGEDMTLWREELEETTEPSAAQGFLDNPEAIQARDEGQGEGAENVG
jgi:large subunit ribosomal protein L9